MSISSASSPSFGGLTLVARACTACRHVSAGEYATVFNVGILATARSPAYARLGVSSSTSRGISVNGSISVTPVRSMLRIFSFMPCSGASFAIAVPSRLSCFRDMPLRPSRLRIRLSSRSRVIRGIFCSGFRSAISVLAARRCLSGMPASGVRSATGLSEMSRCSSFRPFSTLRSRTFRPAMLRRFSDCIPARGAGSRISEYEMSSSTGDSPLSGVRLRSHDALRSSTRGVATSFSLSAGGIRMGVSGFTSYRHT